MQLAKLAAHRFFLPVELDNEVRLAAVEQFAAGSFARRRQREGIGNLEGGRQKTSPKNRLNRPSGVAHRAEAHADAGPERRQRQQLERRLGDDPEQSLGADKKPREVEAGFVFVATPAELRDRAVRQHNLEPEYVVARDAVLEAARAAGVGGDVAADATVRSARRVGRIIQPLGLGGVLQLRRDDAGLNHGDKVARADFADALHLGQTQRDAAVHRHAAANVAEPGAARGHRDAMPVGKLENLRNRLGAAREGHRVGRVCGKPFVAGVPLERALVRAKRALGQAALQLAKQFAAGGCHSTG